MLTRDKKYSLLVPLSRAIRVKVKGQRSRPRTRQCQNRFWPYAVSTAKAKAAKTKTKIDQFYEVQYLHWVKNMPQCHCIFCHYFGKCCPLFHILPLLKSAINFYRVIYYRDLSQSPITRALRHVRSLLTDDVAQTVACSIVAVKVLDAHQYFRYLI